MSYSIDESQDVDDYDFAASLVVFSDTKLVDLSARFRKDADAYYVEAKRSTVSSVAQIPTWMYGILVILGWNEAMFVLFNPLYFTLLLCGVVTAYVPFPALMQIQKNALLTSLADILFYASDLPDRYFRYREQ